MVQPDATKLTPASQMRGEDGEDTALLRQMLDEAINYLTSHNWCPEIVEEYFAFGIGGVVAVFLFEFSARIGGTDDQLWVVVGDLPSAYVVTDKASSARSALLIYCDLMDAWADAVIRNEPLDGVYPVHAEATKENANRLKSRVQFLKSKIIPML